MATAGAVWVDVLPSMKQFGPALSKGSAGPAAAAGRSAGASFGKSMLAGVAVVGAGAGAALKGLYEVGQVFEGVTNTIIVGTGASGKALAGLERSAKNVAKTTPSSFADVGVAVADLNTRLGLTGQPLEEMSSQMLNLSRITKTDLSSNIASLTRVFGDWGIGMKDQPAALDKIFYASQATGASVDSLAQSVVRMGAPLRQFGFSFDESLAIFGKWEKEGVNTQAVMAGLKIGLGQFSKAGKDPQKALAETTEAIKAAGSAGKANEIAIAMFGQRAGPDMAAAVREGRFEIADLVTGIAGSKGVIEDADKRTRTFGDAWQTLKNRALAGVEPLAKRVIGAITTGMTWLAGPGVDALTSFGNWIQDRVIPAAKDAARTFKTDVLPAIKDFGNFVKDTVIPAVRSVVDFFREHTTTTKLLAVAIGTLVAVTKLHSAAMAVQAALLASGGLLGYIKNMRIVSAVTKTWTAVQWLMNAALTANPIGIVVLAIVALVAAAVLAYKRFETFRNIVDAVWKAVQKAVSLAWNYYFKPILTALWSALKFGWEQFQKLKRLAGAAIDGLKDVVRSGVRAVVGFFLAMAENILGAAESAFGWIPGIGPKLRDARSSFREFRDSVNKSLDGIDGRKVTVRADLVAGKGINQGQGGTKGLTLWANGGVREAHHAQIAQAGAMRLWAEPETGGEAYIPLAQAKRPRSARILHQVAQQFGYDLTAYANGGVRDKFGLVTDFTSRRQADAIAAKMQAKIDAGALRAGDVLAQRVTAALAKVAAESGGTTPGANGFAFPLPRGSYRVGGGINSYPGHTGQDFPAPTGTKVFAPFAGNMLTIRLGDRSYGNYANITGGSLRSIQAHLSGFARGPGAVRAGELVGYVGSTGNSTGPHLHQEFRKNGNVVSPKNYITYDGGGYLQPGLNLAYNGTGGPEPVLTAEQMSALTATPNADRAMVEIGTMIAADPQEAIRMMERRQSDAVALAGLASVARG